MPSRGVVPAFRPFEDRIRQLRGQGLLALSVFAYFCGTIACVPHSTSAAIRTKGNGHSREQIARALATSPTEARLRFDPQSPAADGRWPYDF